MNSEIFSYTAKSSNRCILLDQYNWPAGKHLATYLKINSNTAAIFVSIFAIFNGLGRPVYGYLTDHLGTRISASIIFFINTFASILLKNGANIRVIQELLGHEDLKTTQIYAKIIDDKKKVAANKIVLDLWTMN